MNKVIITGPTGTIGHALIEKCIEERTEVYAVCRSDSKRLSAVPEHPLVHIVECELEHLPRLADKLPKECDAFYHFAWAGTTGDGRNNMYLQNQNVRYALDAVELCRAIKCRAFIGAGSQAEYGRAEGALTPLLPVFPENGYGMAKLCAGQMTRVKCRQYGIRHIWTRILSIYGPCDGENSMIISVIRKLLEHEHAKLTRGEQMWDYLYSGDAANAMYLLGQKGISGKTYCIGSGNAAPLRQYIEALRDAVAQSLAEPPAAFELDFGDIPYGEKQVMYLCADISELKKDTGFTAEVPFAEGIAATVDWCKSQ